MRTATVAIVLALASGALLFAQMYGVPVGEPTPTKTGVDAAQQHLTSITVSQFEDAGFWTAYMPSDQGRVEVRRLYGSPADKPERDAERLSVEKDLGIAPGSSVLGVKVDFIQRGKNWFVVCPTRPLAIEGIVKTLSVWVVGRNYNHVLKVMLADSRGEKRELTVGKLNFLGWKRMTVAVPPTIRQSDYHYVARNGLQFLGFKIECDIDEAYGRYYLYFDDLSAVTDLFLEKSRDMDDMQDIW